MPASIPILYSFRRCPYAMRARMAIAYSQQSVELREIILKQKPSSLFDYSPKATVPVLVLNEGRVIDQSLDIMLWALSNYDPDNWQHNLSDQLALIKLNDISFKAKLDKYKYADRYPEPELYYREACYDFLSYLDTKLQNKDYLFADQYCLADIAIFPFIRQFAHVDLSWFESSSWHNVRRWLTALKTANLFSRVMNKYPVWSEQDEPTYFP
jgi:glutathione S-transferase